MTVNVFVLKVLGFRLQTSETAAAIQCADGEQCMPGLFCTDEQHKGILGAVWFAGCHASCWSCCCGSRAFPGDLAGISVAKRSIGGKVSACRLLLMMSSLLICPWAEMKLNRKCFLSSYACECNHCRER